MNLLVDHRVYEIKIPIGNRKLEVSEITDKYVTFVGNVYWSSRDNSKTLIDFYDIISKELYYNDYCKALQVMHDIIKENGIYQTKRVYGEDI
jgi:hypothetical protein